MWQRAIRALTTHRRLTFNSQFHQKSSRKMSAVEGVTADLRTLSTSTLQPAELGLSTSTATSEDPAPTPEVEGEEKRQTAAEKWHNPNGPPVGSHMGARYLEGDKDVWDHNAWYVPHWEGLTAGIT